MKSSPPLKTRATSIRRSPAPGHVIEQNNSSGRVSYWQQGYHQSASDRRGVSTADYIQSMFSFLRQVKAKDVLMIGCGGGTLATMLHSVGVDVTVVDLNRMSFDIARSYFQMPEEIVCKVSDGVTYLKKHRHKHDAVVLDAFGENGMPVKFKTAAFFKLAKSRMKPRGSIFLMNVIVEDDRDGVPAEMVHLLRKQWSRVKIVDREGWLDRNAVIAAGAVTKLKRPKMLMPPKPGAAKLKREMAMLKFRKIK